MDITESHVSGLGAKLAALDLTDGERALLGLIVTAAGDDDVAGFAAADPFTTYYAIAPRFIGPSGDQLGRSFTPPLGTTEPAGAPGDRAR